VPIDRKKLGQIVLVLQGGGALGAYQAGRPGTLGQKKSPGE